jgi:hypothetical protein
MLSMLTYQTSVAESTWVHVQNVVDCVDVCADPCTRRHSDSNGASLQYDGNVRVIKHVDVPSNAFHVDVLDVGASVIV